jgi:hypothetical protein
MINLPEKQSCAPHPDFPNSIFLSILAYIHSLMAALLIVSLYHAGLSVSNRKEL